MKLLTMTHPPHHTAIPREKKKHRGLADWNATLPSRCAFSKAACAGSLRSSSHSAEACAVSVRQGSSGKLWPK